MLLHHLSVPLFAVALTFGASQAWPIVQSTDPGSIKDGIPGDNEPTSSSRLFPLRRRSVSEAPTKHGLLGRATLARRTVGDRTIALTRRDRQLEPPLQESTGKRRKLPGGAKKEPFPGWYSQIDELYLSKEEDHKFYWEWRRCETDRLRLYRTSSPAMRKDLLEEMANWYASQERELPKELGEMIKWQCREDELNQIRHATPWEKWPERPVWAKAEKAIQRDWEERYGEEIAKEDPENTLLANYYKKAELGLSHLPQALTELKSGAQKNAPVILQAAVANMKRFDAAAALKKVKIKPRKGPILL